LILLIESLLDEERSCNVIPEDIPPHREVKIPKSKLRELSEEFEEVSDFLGDRKGAIIQYLEVIQTTSQKGMIIV
jgi:hypothetical protein